jgi:alkylation response protein AidB-like acyl-CoA dehydrogenase
MTSWTDAAWGDGSDDVSVFPELGRQPAEGHETFAVTVHLVAPTIEAHGTPAQRSRFVGRFQRAEQLCCQLFSEPGAGSDLASLSTRAERDGDGWLVNGQKVWTSGAPHAAWGLLIARTDVDAPKHAGLTAFLVPMDAPGVEVRPIRQMTGGASFCEVFLTDVGLGDDLRLGEIGAGWTVALTVLGFERSTSAAQHDVGGSPTQATALARWLGRNDDPLVRQALARLHTHERVRVRDGSLGKLAWTQGMTEIAGTVSTLLGPRLAADTGEWGTYAWMAHVLGAPGYRIAGGSDEIQRNIIGERVLGLPREPRSQES